MAFYLDDKHGAIAFAIDVVNSVGDNVNDARIASVIMVLLVEEIHETNRQLEMIRDKIGQWEGGDNAQS